MIKKFTPAQSQVVHLLAQGEARKEIAYGLGRSIHCVNSHALELPNRMSAKNIIHAVSAGLVVGEIEPYGVLETLLSIEDSKLSLIEPLCRVFYSNAKEIGNLIMQDNLGV